MNKKRVYVVGLAVLTILILLFNICSLAKFYTKDKEFKMLYEVRTGEKLSDIARKFDVDVRVIEQANNNECGEYMAAGRILKIPIK